MILQELVCLTKMHIEFMSREENSYPKWLAQKKIFLDVLDHFFALYELFIVKHSTS